MTKGDESRFEPAKEDAGNYVREVTARYIGPRRKGPTISGPGDAARFMRGLLRDEAREHFLALYLNGGHQVVSFSLVSLGSATAAPVHAREVFQGALLVGACALIVGHNHPSGDVQPSTADKDVTRKLKQAGELLRVPLLDHVLFSETDYVSFHDCGIME
jgi:DNA repair protein RadC